MKKNILIIVLIVLLASAMIFAGCAKEEPAEEPVDETSKEVVEETVEQTSEEPVEEAAEDDEEESVAIHLTDDNYHEIVDNTEGIVIVDFWAEWCPPCLKLGPILEELSVEENIPLYKVDVDYCPEIATEFGITGIPTVIIYKDGIPTYGQSGLGTKEFYLDMIEKAMNFEE